MARANVEMRARGEQRFSKLVDEMGCSRAEALGMLTIFWQDSQERGIWRGSKDAILKFIDAPKADREKWFEAFLEHEYVSPMQDDSSDFVIHGNRKHIEAIEERSELAKKGGQASAEARKIKPNDSKENEPPVKTVEPPVNDAEPNALHFNALQSKTEKQEFENQLEQSKAEQSSPLREQVSQLAAIWEDTLASKNYRRKITLEEQTLLAREISKRGFDAVRRALIGAREEPSTERFDPKKYLRLSRVFGRNGKGEERFPDYLNWFCDWERKQFEKSRPSTADPLPPRPPDESREMPADIREKLRQGGILRSMPKGGAA